MGLDGATALLEAAPLRASIPLALCLNARAEGRELLVSDPALLAKAVLSPFTLHL
jgi:hypothetical protein